jgi:hypothetical protein
VEAAANWSSSDAPTDDMTATAKTTNTEASAAAVRVITLRLPDKGRARKQRHP